MSPACWQSPLAGAARVIDPGTARLPRHRRCTPGDSDRIRLGRRARAHGYCAESGKVRALREHPAVLLLLGIGVLAGADMNVQPPGSTSALAIGPELVVVTAIVPLVPATLLLAAVRRRGPKGWRLLATTGLAVGVVSAAGPLLSTATPGTKAVLVSMHVVTGLIWFVLVRRAARTRPQMVSSDVN
jgi:Family of unknown function (DUF6069)